MHNLLLLVDGFQVVVELVNFWGEAYFVKRPLVDKHQLVELTYFLFLLERWKFEVGLVIYSSSAIRVAVIIVNVSQLVTIWLVLVLQRHLVFDLLVLAIQC